MAKLKTNCQWVHVIFIENYFNSYNKKDGSGKAHVISLHLRGVEGQDMTSKLFCMENEDGELIANSIFTQMWFAKYKPQLLIQYINARKKRNTKVAEEIYEEIKSKNKELGLGLMADKEEFLKKLNIDFEGFQFRLYWQPQGLNSFGKKVDARPASTLMNVTPIGKNNYLETIEDRSITNFIETYRRGSIEDRTDESLEGLEEFDDVFDFETDEVSSEETTPATREMDINGIDENDSGCDLNF